MIRILQTPLVAALALVFACSATALVAQEAETVTTKEERKALLAKVKESEKSLIKLVKGLTTEQWTYTPEDGGWSIAGVCEHIWKAENGLLGFAEKTMGTPKDASMAEEMRAKWDQIFAYATNRGPETRAEAPPSAQPEGKFATPTEFIAAFQETLAKKRAFIAGNDLRAHHGPFPSGEEQDVFNFVAFSTAHTLHHILQAEEVMTEAGYPAGKAPKAPKPTKSKKGA